MLVFMGQSIQVHEAPGYSVVDVEGGNDYTVGGESIIYMAQADAGRAFALTPDQAVEGVKALILKASSRVL